MSASDDGDSGDGQSVEPNGVATSGVDEQPQRQPTKDPMKSFRGVLAGTLVLEAIVVALALPVVAQVGSGVTSLQGWVVVGIAVGLVAACGFLRRRMALWLVLAMQVALIGFVATLPSIAIVGGLFLGVLLWLLKLRRDVARRMAAGLLPAQQEQA